MWSLQVPGCTSSKVTSTISPASVVRFAGNTRLNDSNRMSVGACKKPSKYSTFESWDCLRAMFVHAHESTVAEAREMRRMPICCLHASKRFENVCPSLRHTQDLNDHICASFCLSQPLGSSTSPDQADPAYLAGVAANIDSER